MWRVPLKSYRKLHSPKKIKTKNMKHQYKPLLLLSLVFLTVGVMFCMNDILLPSLVEHFEMSYFQATMIQFSFYITYIIFPFPIAWIIHTYGYSISLLVALFFCALGCLIFIPAKLFDSYLIVLAAICLEWPRVRSVILKNTLVIFGPI